MAWLGPYAAYVPEVALVHARANVPNVLCVVRQAVIFNVFPTFSAVALYCCVFHTFGMVWRCVGFGTGPSILVRSLVHSFWMLLSSDAYRKPSVPKLALSELASGSMFATKLNGSWHTYLPVRFFLFPLRALAKDSLF